MEQSTAAAKPLTLRHFVGGEWHDGDGREVLSLNPADPSKPVASYRQAGAALLDLALASAVSAQPAWDQLGLIGRGRVLRRAAELLALRSDELARLTTAEEGKTLPESKGEIDASVETLYYHAAAARNSTGAVFASSNPDELIRTVRRPVGTVGVITPWNFPVQIPVWKIAPALLWGNAVVWKPASETPAVSVMLAEVFEAAGVPAGVLNLLLAPGELGTVLVASEQVSAITFTGSVPVGRSIARVAVERRAKVQLELGGHNAAIVMPDVDPGLAADALVAGAMGSTGQKCTATRRIIAVGEAYDLLVPEIRTRIESLRVGNGAEAGIDIGPLVSARARSDVTEAIETAIQEGAEVVARTDIADLGESFLAPTVLAGSPDLAICNDEVFGPVTTILRARDLDEAIEIANRTAFGLTATVFTSDEVTVRRCVDEIDAGLVKANAPTTGSELHVPFGGLKASSFPAPREQNSESSADFFTWTKSAYLRTAPHWDKR